MFILTDMNNVFIDYGIKIYKNSNGMIAVEKVDAEKVLYGSDFNIIEISKVPSGVYPQTHKYENGDWVINESWVEPEGWQPPTITPQKKEIYDINEFYDMIEPLKFLEFMESTDPILKYYRIRLEKFSVIDLRESNVATRTAMGVLLEKGILSQEIYDMIM